MTTPILFATLGCLLCNKVNVFNIALEGQMLLATFVAIAVNHVTYNLLLSCICGGEVTVLGGECVKKSYPDFWEVFASLGGEAERREDE